MASLFEFVNVIYHSVIRFLQYIDYNCNTLSKVKKAHIVSPIVTEDQLSDIMTILAELEPEEKWSELMEEARALFSGSLEGPEIKYIMSSYRVLFTLLHACRREYVNLKEISPIVNAIDDPSLLSWDAFIQRIEIFIPKMISSWTDLFPNLSLPPSQGSMMHAHVLNTWEEKMSLLRTAVATSSPAENMSEEVVRDLRDSFVCACRR